MDVFCKPTIARLSSLVILIICASIASNADAAPPWVSRGTNLPRGDLAFDPGFGIGYSHDDDTSAFGAGANLEAAVGVMQNLEIGMRTGVRFGDAARRLRPDQDGRLFDRQTFGTDHDTFANPELRVRGRVIHGAIVELALEGRAYLPFEDGSHFGIMFGVPFFFHIGPSVRLDTGMYVPIIFRDKTETVISVPIDLWIQATQRLWLGPMSGVRFNNPQDTTDISFGFGLGYQAALWLDLKTMLVIPKINHHAGARHLGAGIALQIRIE